MNHGAWMAVLLLRQLLSTQQPAHSLSRPVLSPPNSHMHLRLVYPHTPQAHKKAIRRATVNTFGYIAKAIGPQDVLVTLLNNLKVQERQNRVCTTVAIAIVAETCAPFTVLPALMNEYKVGGVGWDGWRLWAHQPALLGSCGGPGAHRLHIWRCWWRWRAEQTGSCFNNKQTSQDDWLSTAAQHWRHKRCRDVSNAAVQSLFRA